jgi:hypothetical protein
MKQAAAEHLEKLNLTDDSVKATSLKHMSEKKESSKRSKELDEYLRAATLRLATQRDAAIFRTTEKTQVRFVVVVKNRYSPNCLNL